ncbi:MAG: branched-chain amino acid aminotransferase [Oscillospiraceae bacterium]|nr:branched-chain amino acid aminotransferase [Oscillospiraceae bacterium]
MNLTITKTTAPKTKPEIAALGFGRHFSDHMLVVDYETSAGWHDARIVPYAPFSLDPAAMVFHYAQEAFEGLKAYPTDDGSIQLFRPQENFKRFNKSCERLCMAKIDEDFALESLKELLRIDADWVPRGKGTSLYIRPFIIATDPFLGVRASQRYIYSVILSPVGAYYPEGLNPVKIIIEVEDVRAVRGGTGAAKIGGNYAGTIRAQVRAQEKGYTQVLWLDAVERKYIEEVGTMHMFFQIGNEIVTPSLDGTILEGITRDSVIHMLHAWGHTVIERKISIDELHEALQNGQLKEAFGTGTAAAISPVGQLSYQGVDYAVNAGKTGEIAAKLYDTLTGIQWGRIVDPYGWTIRV